jgi:hypothetical protein
MVISQRFLWMVNEMVTFPGEVNYCLIFLMLTILIREELLYMVHYKQISKKEQASGILPSYRTPRLEQSTDDTASTADKTDCH